jgi:hypothetical protein
MTVSAFSLTSKVINAFNHFSLQPSQRLVSGDSQGLPCWATPLTTQHTALGHLSNCLLYCSTSLPPPTAWSHSALRVHISFCHDRYTSHMQHQAEGCMHHNHFHTLDVTSCHILIHTFGFIISYSWGTHWASRPQAQDHTYYHTVSFPQVYVFDSHDVTPVMYPSLSSESYTRSHTLSISECHTMSTQRLIRSLHRIP